MDTNDRMRTNIPSQKRRKRETTLLLYELNEAETEVKNTQNAVMLKAKLSQTPRTAGAKTSGARIMSWRRRWEREVQRWPRNFTRRSVVVRLMPVSCAGVCAVRLAYRNAAKSCPIELFCPPAESRVASSRGPPPPARIPNVRFCISNGRDRAKNDRGRS